MKLFLPSCFTAVSGSELLLGLGPVPGPRSEHFSFSIETGKKSNLNIDDRFLEDGNVITKTAGDKREHKRDGEGKDKDKDQDQEKEEKQTGTDEVKEIDGDKGKEKEKEKDLGRRRSGVNDISKDRKREREKEVEKEKEKEMNSSFSGDFLFDYYDCKSSPSSQEITPGPVSEKLDSGNYHTMRVSINEGPALALMDKCLDLAAINCRHLSSGIELRSLAQGPSRRGIVDDITILVVTLQ